MLEVVVFMRHPDPAILPAWLAATTWLGARFRRGRKSLRGRFLEGRTAPWRVIGAPGCAGRS